MRFAGERYESPVGLRLDSIAIGDCAHVFRRLWVLNAMARPLMHTQMHTAAFHGQANKRATLIEVSEQSITNVCTYHEDGTVRSVPYLPTTTIRTFSIVARLHFR